MSDRTDVRCPDCSRQHVRISPMTKRIRVGHEEWGRLMSYHCECLDCGRKWAQAVPPITADEFGLHWTCEQCGAVNPVELANPAEGTIKYSDACSACGVRSRSVAVRDKEERLVHSMPLGF